MLGTSCCVFVVARPFQSQLCCYFQITLCDRRRALYHSHFVVGPSVRRVFVACIHHGGISVLYTSWCCVFVVVWPFQSQLCCYFRITLCGDRGRALYHSHFVCPCIGPEVIVWVCHGDERISCWEIPSISRLVILTIVVKFHVLLLECGNMEGLMPVSWAFWWMVAF